MAARQSKTHRAKTQRSKIGWRAVLISLVLSAIMLLVAIAAVEDMTARQVLMRILKPLGRMMVFILIGLMAGQILEATGWHKSLGALAAPLFTYANLGRRCGAAFTTAFFSGVAANAMLLEYYKQNRITRAQLFVTNLVNHLPAYFLHLPTTFFLVVSLTRGAGILYFLITFAATLLRCGLALLYGHLRLPATPAEANQISGPTDINRREGITTVLRTRLPARFMGVVIYVVPIYVLIFVVQTMGYFSLIRNWMGQYVATTFIPVEALSMVVISFAAEFTSGFAAAGAMLDAGLLSTKQTVLALLAGNLVAFPIRALRHQLPRYMGIFSPKMGLQLLLVGQGARLSSLIVVGIGYYFIL